MSREHDIVVYGATGFTGELAAQYLASRPAEETVRWAVAGRNATKLEAVADRLHALAPSRPRVETIVARSDDRDSLAAMARRTRVVLTTVGPYAGRGELLVDACVDAGTDYVDITGEPGFWKDMIERHHARAEASGVLVVSCCGFDSIPHDMGAWFTARHIASRVENGTPVTTRGYVRARGQLSGGTWNTLVDTVTRMPLRRKPSGAQPSSGRRPHARVHHVAELDRWAIPFPTVDPLVVRRSATMCDVFPDDFVYEHYFPVRSRFRVATTLGGVGALFAVTRIPGANRLLGRLRPPGTGPDPDARERGWFEVTFVTEAGDRRFVTRVRGGDPGYGHTSKMCAEAAACLAKDRDVLPRRGGVLTPAAAMGEALLPRLEATGMTFEVMPEA